MYIEVAVASPIANTLTYLSRSEFVESIYKPGLRLLVPLGPRLVTGYIMRCVDQLDFEPKYAIRAINDVQDQEPIFPESMVPFFEWLAGYYHYPIGEVIKCALPGGLSPQSGRQVDLTPNGHTYFSSQPSSSHPTESWFKKLFTDQKLSLAATQNSLQCVWRPI